MTTIQDLLLGAAITCAVLVAFWLAVLIASAVLERMA